MILACVLFSSRGCTVITSIYNTLPIQTMLEVSGMTSHKSLYYIDNKNDVFLSMHRCSAGPCFPTLYRMVCLAWYL